MGWLKLVGSLKIQVSFAKEPLFCRALLQKRPIFLGSIQAVATPQRQDWVSFLVVFRNRASTWASQQMLNQPVPQDFRNWLQKLGQFRNWASCQIGGFQSISIKHALISTQIAVNVHKKILNPTKNFSSFSNLLNFELERIVRFLNSLIGFRKHTRLIASFNCSQRTQKNPESYQKFLIFFKSSQF